MLSPDIGNFIERGQVLTESMQTFINLSENPANSVEAAETMISVAGLAIGVVGSLFDGEVAKVLTVATDNWKTIDQRTPIELSSEVAAMPEVIGISTLGSLRQAMSAANQAEWSLVA